MSDGTHNIICLWSGAIADIPDGWKLCDGNNNTPDLRNRFVVGAGGYYPPNSSSGAAAHTHTYTGDGHDHSMIAGPNITFGVSLNKDTDSEQGTGTTDSDGDLPPYYALCYIMKK